MAAAVPFALNPAAANDDVLDYNTRESQNLFKANTRSLHSDETLFGAEAAALEGFIAALARRTREAAWEATLTVPVDIDDQGAPVPGTENLFLLDHCGEFELEHLQLCSGTCVDEETRQAQDNFQIVTATLNSLSEDANAKVMPCQDEFVPDGTENISALSLIKVIVRESDIDTNATTMHIRQDSSELDEEFARQACDVIALNTHVKSKLKALRTRGEQTLDLLPNLFKACESAEDEDF
jgi:hypothetical protein